MLRELIMATASRLAVLLFTDLVGSTDLKDRIGTAAYMPLLERHNALFEPLCREHNGEILKHTGDGFFAAFTTASDAVRAALAFQQTMRDQAWPHSMSVRIGIHVGEVAITKMAGRPDVIGFAADLAARVMSLAAGGQVLLTQSAFNDARQFVSDGQLRWVAHGAYLFKGIDETIEVFEVGSNGAPLAAPTGGEKARRVVPHDQEQTLGWRPGVGLEIDGRTGWNLERKLGEGGFGEVWLAQHGNTKQRRVFKFCFDAERLRSFKRELTLFRLLREALGDRNDIAKLYDVKLDHPPFFLESEWTEGGNLVEWAQSHGGVVTIPFDQRMEVVAKVSDAVAAAHSVGILHKDIKPTNILVQQLPDGSIQPRLADFGIGFLADRSQLRARHITETGFTVITQSSGSSMTGTRLYSPPEVLVGKPFTTQGDIYALGVLLYQMAVGDLSRPLAEGWERDVADPLIREDIAECCDGDPARRPGGALAVAQRIRALSQRREEARERAIAAEASERRQRVLWRSIAVSVGMAILVVAVALSSAFYIRRVRAARASETIQRQRAEGAEHEARKAEAAAQAEAARARRHAAFFNAQYLLAESRVKEAYQAALTANAVPARWEDGHLLQQIVSASRRAWEVVGRIEDSTAYDEIGPGEGCFVRRGDAWVLALPRGRTVELYSVPRGDRLASVKCRAIIGSLCPGDRGRLFIASGRTLMLWDIESMKQLASAQNEEVIDNIVARPGAPAIAALDKSGRVAVHASSDLKLLAGRTLRFGESTRSGAMVRSIDISPSGVQIVAHSGTWTDGYLLWNWKSDQVVAGALPAHHIVFKDEQTLAGFWNWGVGLDEASINLKAVSPPDAPRMSTLLHDLKGKTSARLIERMKIWPVNAGWLAAVVSAEGIDVRTVPGGQFVSSDLYASILPFSQRPPRVVAHDVPCGNLALLGDDLVLLGQRSNPAYEMWTNGWSLSTTDRGMFTCVLRESSDRTLSAALLFTAFDGETGQTLPLEWPGVTGKDVRPWGIWSPPDGSFVAVLRQETQPGEFSGTIGSQYYARSIAIYDIANQSDAPTPLKIRKQISLPEFDGVDGRNNRFICVTPDQSVALYCSHGVEATRYRVADGKLLSRETLGTWAAPSQDGRLIVAGGGTERVKVWDVAGGNVIFTTPDGGNPRKACFSADNRSVCVSWAGREIAWYDIASGQRIRSVRTPLLPVAVPASGTGDRFVGFLPDSGFIGGTVMASTIDGEVAVMLNRGANVQNAAWFDPSGTRVATIQYRDRAQLICALTPAQARAALDPKQIKPGARPTTLPTIEADMPAPATREAIATTVPWERAGEYVGQTITVEGTIVMTRNITSRCFLNFAANYRGKFVIVLNANTFTHWPELPEKWFADKTIRVTGKVDLFRGTPQIIVSDPAQIEIVDQR